MPHSTAAAPTTASTDRLRSLLLAPDGLGDEALSEARALGPERTGEVVSALIDADRLRPRGDGSALRAVHLARELELTGAIPALTRCLSLPEGRTLRHAARVVLTRFGNGATDALLAAFERCRMTAARPRIAEALSRAPVEDDRIRAALVRMLDDDPANAAWYLGDRGEWRALPDLLRAFDRLATDPIADCDACAAEHLSAIAAAVRVLGGTISEARNAKLDELLERSEALFVPFDDPLLRPSPTQARAARDACPGRNEPCPCGSGKKYKKCHLAADRRSARH